MKVEILACGKIENALNNMDIKYKTTYSGDKYKVIELEKSDAKTVNNSFLEGAWCYFSNGMGGSIYDVVSIHGSTLFGWQSKKDSYEKLTDYISSLGAKDNYDVCDKAVGLAKANGLSLSKLFMLYEG